MFVGLHAALAIKTGVEELAITMEEGDQFMTRAQAVMSHYSVETTQKTMDWIAFAGCAGMIYAPRLAAVMQAKSGRNRQRQQQAPDTSSNVSPFQAFMPPEAQGFQ